MLAMSLGKRIRTARKAKDLSQSKLGKLLGLTRNAVSQWEGDISEPRPETLRKLPVILDVGMDWLATGRPSQSEVVQGIPYRGEVAGGVWREITETQDMEFRRVPVAPDPSYPIDAQYALQVRGNSVNKVAKDGATLHCVDIASSGLELRHNDLVVVERRRGSLVEATVKRLRKGKDGLELWPESDDPAHQQKLTLGHPRGAEEVSIKALVIATLTPVPRGR